MKTKKEYMREAELKYEALQMAESHAAKLEYMIKVIRDLGFKVIVLGSKVRVTVP